ncbi:hypothetical protein QUA82_01805 [Microcoleus sp. F8-D3]
MSEHRCCTIVKNGQDARDAKNDFSRFTAILAVPKQVIEKGAISQSEFRSQNSEGKKEEGRIPMEVGRRKERRSKERRSKETTIPNTQCPVLPMANALFGKYPATPHLPEKGYTTDSTVQLFLAKINQKKAALLSW